jgi:hypothetical protein
MENYLLEKDITVFYIQASSFPEGVMAAHQQLHAALVRTADRRFFGISRPEGKTGIVYKAAAEELNPGEGNRLGYETMLLPKGNYLSLVIKDFRKDIPSIGSAFTEMLHQPGIDPNGFCLEWYLNDCDVQCMVRLK